jgi:hypothetical protein
MAEGKCHGTDGNVKRVDPGGKGARDREGARGGCFWMGEARPRLRRTLPEPEV